MSVTLTFPTDMPVKWGSDFNALDACNPGFTPQYCQAVERTDTTPFQIEIAQSGVSQAAVQGDWGAAAGWTINSNGTVTHAGAGVTGITWSGAFTSGELYRVTLVVTGVTTGTFTCTDVAGLQSSHSFNTVQTEVFVFTPSTADLGLLPAASFDGTIQVTVENIESFNFGTTNKIINGTFASDTSWGKGTGWTIAAGIASKAAGVQSLLDQGIHTPTIQSPTNVNIFTGKLYRVTWTVSGRTAGSIFLTGGNINQGQNWGKEQNTNATFTDYIVIRNQAASVDTVIGFDADSSFDGDIDNITVFELANTQFRIEDCDGRPMATIQDRDIHRVSDARENADVDWDDIDFVDLINDGTFDTPLASGTTTSDTALKLNDAGASFLSDGLAGLMIVMNTSTGAVSTIDTIDSNILITLQQDIFTATPEGYEIYEWLSSTIAADLIAITGGVAVLTGVTNTTLAQAIQPVVGAVYRVTFDVLNYVSGSVRPRFNDSGSATTGTSVNANGSFSQDITFLGPLTASTAFQFITSDDATTLDIDNVTLTQVLADDCFNICVDTWNGTSFVEQDCTECYCLADTHPCTLLFTQTNDENAFGVDYATASFTWSQRLRAKLVNPRYPLDIINNKDNLGVLNLLSGEQEKTPHLISDDWPEYVHDWVSVMLIHDTWTIDASRYVAEPEDYEPIWRDPNGKLTLSKSRTEVKKAIQKNINHNG